jgi:hypothetical protein
MLIHHIKTLQLQNLTEMFSFHRESAIVTPRWILDLLETATDKYEVLDFQTTSPDLLPLKAS